MAEGKKKMSAKGFLLAAVLLISVAFTFVLLAWPADQAVNGARGLTPLGFGIATVAAVGALFVFARQEKAFMRRHVFRPERIRKKMREEDYES